MTPLLLTIIVLALAFDYINGFHDSANAIATVVSTRVLRPLTAVLFGGALNLVGALLGTQVATTIGRDLVSAQVMTGQTIIVALIAAILWDLATWYKGLPTSSSHALIGALLGAAFAGAAGGADAIHWHAVWDKVVVPMLASPLLGFFIGLAVMTGLTWLVYRMRPARINRIFGHLQILSAGLMALSHGRNDAQKSMGIIALALTLAHPGAPFHVPLWVILACGITMAVGTASGGWRIIRTLGTKMIHLQPIQGFAAETTAAAIISGTSALGMPVSTTQVISSAILGVGSTRGLSAVRWGIVGDILWAWVLTLPLTFALAAGMTILARYCLPGG